MQAGDPFQQVTSGQDVRNSARLHNILVRVARDYEGRHNGASNGNPLMAYEWPTILVKNTSGADVDRYGVLGIDSIGITPSDNADEWDLRPLFTGVTPAVTRNFARLERSGSDTTASQISHRPIPAIISDVK